MPIELSENDRSCLFGVGCKIDEYTEKFRAAQYFYEVRKAAEAQKTKLGLLAPRQFKRNRAVFEKNVTKSLTEHQHSQLLLPLIINNPTIDGLKSFILSCFTISSSQYQNLTGSGLTELFAELFRDVMGSITILSDTLKDIQSVIKQICEKNKTESSTNLLNVIKVLAQLPATPRDYPNQHAVTRARLEEDGDSLHQHVAKRARLEEDVEDDTTSPPEFPLELLDAAAKEEINPDEIPDAEPRRIVMQMTSANANRLERLLRDSPLLEAIKTSRQWRWERMKPLQKQTNCMIALIAGSGRQDISFVIKVGSRAGWWINEYLRYEGSGNDA